MKGCLSSSDYLPPPHLQLQCVAGPILSLCLLSLICNLEHQEIWGARSRRTGLLGGQAHALWPGQRAGCRREAFALYRGFLRLFPLTGQTHFPDISGKTSASEVSPVGEDASESPHLNTESI